MIDISVTNIYYGVKMKKKIIQEEKMESKIYPNAKLKLLLFERGITQRQFGFATGIDAPRISTAIKYGITTPEMRKKITAILGVQEKEIFPNE